MKRSLLILATLICSTSLYSQELNLACFYSQREIGAPMEVKEKLGLTGKEIAVRELKYQVGYTTVADIPLEKVTVKIDSPPQLSDRTRSGITVSSSMGNGLNQT